MLKITNQIQRKPMRVKIADIEIEAAINTVSIKKTSVIILRNQ